MSVPSDQIEEITRVVLRVIQEHRPAATSTNWRSGLWNWAKANPTPTLALIGVVGLVIALAILHVGPWAVAAKIAADYREAQQRGDLIEEHLNLGNRFLGAQELDAARAEFEEALKVEPTNVEAQRGLFRATVFEPIVRRGYDPAIAQMRLRFLLQQDADDAHAHAFLGDVYMEQFDFAQALEQYRAALKKDNSLAHAYGGAGLAYSFQNMSNDAVEMYRRALKFAPSSQIYRNNLAYEFFRMGRYEESKREYDHVLRSDPSYLLSYNVASNVYRITGDLETARRYQEYLVRLFADPQIRALERNGSWWAFRTETQRVTAVDPGAVYLVEYKEKRAYALLNLALTAHLQRDTGEARSAALHARRAQLTAEQARSIRTVILFDTALLTKERTEYAATVRAFRKIILSDFGLQEND